MRGMKCCQGGLDRFFNMLFILPLPAQRKANVVRANACKIWVGVPRCSPF